MFGNSQKSLMIVKDMKKIDFFTAKVNKKSFVPKNKFHRKLISTMWSVNQPNSLKGFLG